MLFENLKNDILGKEYSISIAFVSSKKIREINKKYRNQDRATNVLSFYFSKNEGELLLCKPVIKTEAENSGKTFEQWRDFLLIHGMLHLKGMEHGSTMNEAEKKFCKKYDKKYFYRHRPGVIHDAGRRPRIRKRRRNS